MDINKDFLNKYFDNSVKQPVPYRKGELWGFSDIWGNITIEPQYDEVNFFNLSESTDLGSFRAIVRKQEYYYIIDVNNAYLTKGCKSIFETTTFSQYSFHGLVTFDDKHGVFFNNKIIINTIYDSIDVDENSFKVELDGKLY